MQDKYISDKGAANSFYPLVLGKKVNIEGYGYILVVTIKNVLLLFVGFG